MNRRHRRYRAVLAAGALLGGLAAACTPQASHRPVNPASEQGLVITRDDIARFRVTTAWDAVRRGATYLVMREDARGGSDRVSYRGATSFLLTSDVMFVVDGTVLTNYHALRDIRAETVAYIRILSGVEGTRIYGTGAGNGVVVVATSTPME